MPKRLRSKAKKVKRVIADMDLDPHRQYPYNPGSQGTDTSRAAAKSVRATAASMRVWILGYLKKVGSSSIEDAEIAYGLDPTKKNSLHCRFSELKEQELVQPTGRQHRNISGRMADILELV